MSVPVIAKPSPNFSLRPKGLAVDLLVIHADASPHESGTISWVQSTKSKVSYHYYVGRDGTVYQFVNPDKKAWHAGESVWQGRVNCNTYSIGLSFANKNDGVEEYTEAQLRAGAHLAAFVMRMYPKITLSRIVGHCDVSPGRKTDPGPLFPWQRFVALVNQQSGGNATI